jgi:diguanylate cyclase (GGDEF)-like protein
MAFLWINPTKEVNRVMSLAERKTIGATSNNLEYIAAYLEQDKNELQVAGQQLALKLQRTLDVDLLLSIFCQEAAQLVPCESVAYRNDEFGLFIYHGEKHESICQYALEIEDEHLGTIECSARRAFTEKELIRLEHLLALLLFPLRNALLYLKAVQMAHKDPLTQLGNRSAYESAIETEISRAERHGAGLCMLVVDIDHFKSINDSYGHLAGDQVLKQVARCLEQTLRKEDQVFRYGGEEFVVLLSATDLPNARLTAERLRMQLEALNIKALEFTIPVTASIGVAEWQKGELGNTLFHRADQALYQAKQKGRNRVVVA